MATKRVIQDWTPYRFFPWIEHRKVGLFLTYNPGITVDLSACWTERRFRRSIEGDSDNG